MCNSIGSFLSNCWSFITLIFKTETQKITKAVQKSVDKTIDIIKKAYKTEYWLAAPVTYGKSKKVSSYIPIAPLDYSRAISVVKSGGSVFAVSKSSAYKLAKAAGNGAEPTKPEIHGGLGFFKYYHTNKRTGGHIFFI